MQLLSNISIPHTGSTPGYLIAYKLGETLRTVVFQSHLTLEYLLALT